MWIGAGEKKEGTQWSRIHSANISEYGIPMATEAHGRIDMWEDIDKVIR